jgi:hypothetical protein
MTVAEKMTFEKASYISLDAVQAIAVPNKGEPTSGVM